MSAVLSNMRTFVSVELGVYDEVSLLLITAFLSQNYIDIWDKYPWGDSNGYGVVSVSAGTPFANYPDGMDRIITLMAVQGTTPEAPTVPSNPGDPSIPTLGPYNMHFLDPIDSTFLIESEPNLYLGSSYLKYYEEIGDAAQRKIRLYSAPLVGTTLFFYGKMTCPGLSADTDSSLIRNIDAAIMAYAAADMLQRQRQYGKADLRRKQALELETNAWNLEQQQANKPRRTKATTIAGNSLREMTDAVCQICGQWTPEYQQIIREFLRRNYQALYDVYLWPESLVVVRVPYTTEQVVMPSYIDKVLGVRGTTNMRMFPADAGLFLDVSPAIFDEIGDPIGYSTLTPVGVSTLPATTTKLVLASEHPLDNSLVMIRGEVLSTGQELEEALALNGTTPVYTNRSYDVPITVAKDVTFGAVTVNAASDMRSLEVIPPYLRELKHQRLWFLPAPDGAKMPDAGFFTCLVLGKRGIRPLLIDQDTPIITGAQQVLIAAAAADVFRKLEKPDQATAFQQKASASMDVLKAKNTDQAASAPRFVPQVEPRAYFHDTICGKW